MTLEAQEQFEALEGRLRAMLPEEYQDGYEDVQPVSMGSAGLKYDAEGRVAWDEIWETFCDLAMAGGPPHKGKLLEPGSSREIDAEPDRYRQVVDEICRGVAMVTDLAVKPSSVPGWVGAECLWETKAAWLERAIIMENVSVRSEGTVLELPAGPGYRLEKEIKNVITVIAKTCHYWDGHMWSFQQREIGGVIAEMEAVSPLIRPAVDEGIDQGGVYRAILDRISEAIQQATHLRPVEPQCTGWFGMECPDVRAAVWMMRAFVGCNVLSRREGTVLFVPVNPASDPGGETVIRAVTRVYGFAVARGVIAA